MEQIQVARWLFWPGVLVLVVSIALSALYGQQLNPPYGTDWNITPLLVTIALVLMLASVVMGGPRDHEDRGDPR